MATTRACNSAITAGRLSKAIEFLGAAESLDDDKPNAAGDLFVDAEAANLLSNADRGSGRHLSALLSFKNKAAHTHLTITPVG